MSVAEPNQRLQLGLRAILTTHIFILCKVLHRATEGRGLSAQEDMVQCLTLFGLKGLQVTCPST